MADVEPPTAPTDDRETPPTATRRRLLRVVLPLVLVIVLGVLGLVLHARASQVILTGIVTTHDVIVGAQMGGQIQRLSVGDGDRVTRGQLLAILAPEELRADQDYYQSTATSASIGIQQDEAALRFQERQTASSVRQAEAWVAAANAQVVEALAGERLARVTFTRNEALVRAGAVSPQDVDQLQTNVDVAHARVDAATRQLAAQQAALVSARATAEQIAMRRGAVLVARQQSAAASAAAAKAAIRVGYTEVRAPIKGVVDVVAVRPGEVVVAGQAVATLVDPDDLWVRADVEEGSAPRIRLGDRMKVRLPSGRERTGVVFYRGVDADFATQRDVSRSKRDIKTFEIRLRVDNRDRALAVGMTAYVLLPANT